MRKKIRFRFIGLFVHAMSCLFFHINFNLNIPPLLFIVLYTRKQLHGVNAGFSFYLSTYISIYPTHNIHYFYSPPNKQRTVFQNWETVPSTGTYLKMHVHIGTSCIYTVYTVYIRWKVIPVSVCCLFHYHQDKRLSSILSILQLQLNNVLHW